MHLKKVKTMNPENNITINKLAEHMRREHPHLMRYACYRLGDADDAKDALQDVFLKISAKLSGEKSVEVRDWRNYIFRALSNLCSSRLAATGKLRTIPLDTRLDIADIPTESSEADYQRIAQLLVEIPEEQAEVIRIPGRDLANERVFVLPAAVVRGQARPQDAALGSHRRGQALLCRGGCLASRPFYERCAQGDAAFHGRIRTRDERGRVRCGDCGRGDEPNCLGRARRKPVDYGLSVRRLGLC